MPRLPLPNGQFINVPEGATQEQVQSLLSQATAAPAGTAGNTAYGRRAMTEQPPRTVEESLAGINVEGYKRAVKETATSTLPIIGAGAFAVMDPPMGMPLALRMAGGGAIRLATLGGATGEAARQVSNRVLGLSAPETSSEAARSIAMEGAKAGLTEAVPRVVLGGVSRMLNPMGPWRQSAEAVARYTTARKEGLDLSAAEITHGAVARWVQDFVDRSALGRGVAEARKARLFHQITGALADVAHQFSMQPVSRELTGEALKDGVSLARQAFHETGSAMLKEVGKEVGNVPVDISDLRVFAGDRKKEIAFLQKNFPGAFEPGGDMGKVMEALLASPKTATPTMTRLPGGGFSLSNPKPVAPISEMPWDEMVNMRSKVLEYARESKAAKNYRAERFFNGLADETAKAMEKTANKASPVAKTMWEDWRGFYREGSELFERTAIVNMASKDPEKLVASIPVDGISQIRAIKTALNDYRFPAKSTHAGVARQPTLTPTWEETFRRQYTQNLFKDPEGSGMLNFNGLRARLDAIPQSVVNEVYMTNGRGAADVLGAAQWKRLNDIADATKDVRHLSETGQIPGQPTVTVSGYLMMSALAGFYHSKALLGGELMSLTLPAALTRVINSSKATEALLAGFHKPLARGWAPALSNFERAVELGYKGVDIVGLRRDMAKLEMELAAEKAKGTQPGGAPQQNQGQVGAYPQGQVPAAR